MRSKISLSLVLNLMFCLSLSSQNVGINNSAPDHLLDIRSDETPGPVLNLANIAGDKFFRLNSHHKLSDDPSMVWKTGQSMKMFLGSADGTIMTEFLRFNGKGIGFFNTGESVFLGEGAGSVDDLISNHNVGIGKSSMLANTSGVSNVAIGSGSLSSNVGGNDNVVLGRNAANKNNSGNFNVSIGHSALFNNQSGQRNTVIGTHAGQGQIGISYSDNVLIGYEAGKDVSQSNKLYIDNTSTPDPLIYGEFDNNLLRVNGKAEVTGRIKVGDDASTASPGMIRFNSSSNTFEGYNGSEWIPFGVQAGPFGSAQVMSEETDSLQPIFSDVSVNAESIAIAGDIMVLGAPNFDDNLGAGIFTGLGSVLVYKKSGSSWQKILELSDPAAQVNSRFGYAVETDGNKIIVGAPGYDSGANTDEGRVYVYKREVFGFSWPLEQSLWSSASSSYQFFGDNLNLTGNDLIIGGPGIEYSYGFNNITGRAFIFNYNSSNWTEQGAFSNSETILGDGFGADVAIDGDYAVVGAPDQTSRGKAYIYARSGSTWSEVKILNVADSPSIISDNFGESVAIRGTDVVVAAPGYEINGNVAQGQIWGFEKVVNNWLVSFTKTAPEELEFCYFGRHLRNFGDKLLVNSGLGKIYTYNKSGNTYEFESILIKKKLTDFTDFDVSSNTVVSTKKFEDRIHYYE